MSYAIRLLMKRIAEEQRLPSKLKVPGKTSQIALDEIKAGKTERSDSVEALMADLNAES